MPVDSRLKPIVVTTQAETMGLTNRRQYFAVRPRSPSMQPPTMTAPIISPESFAASVIIADRNVKLRPITTGSREPIRQTG